MRFSRPIQVHSFFVMILLCASMSTGESKAKYDPVIGLPVDENTVIRIFYLPANDYLHPALFFRVAAGAQSSLLNTAPITNRGGRTPFISLAEMQDLVQKLDDAGLSWRKSRKLEVAKAVGFRETTGRLEIKIFSSRGTALSLSDPKRICQTLAPLDFALKQPRALWEFRLLRVEYHCEVPGFDRKAYPNHDAPDEE